MPKRRVVVYDEYLDGIEGLMVRKPDEFDEHYRLVDAELLDALEAAERAYHAAETRVREAYAEAKDHRNPKCWAEVVE